MKLINRLIAKTLHVIGLLLTGAVALLNIFRLAVKTSEDKLLIK